MSASASKDEGMRAAKVGREAVTSGARGDGFGKGNKTVKGPGQNREMRGW